MDGLVLPGSVEVCGTGSLRDALGPSGARCVHGLRGSRPRWGQLLTGLWLAPAVWAGGSLQPASDASAFLDSLGVVSTISRRGEQLERTIEALRFLGLRWVRSGYESDVPVADLLEVHRRTGVRFSYGLLSGGNDLDRLFRGARQLAEAGALLALEGNNEPNNWPVQYQGMLGGGDHSWLPVAKLQRDLHRRAKADPILGNIPVWTVSEPGAQTDNVGLQFLEIPAGVGTRMPPGTRFGDFANVHNYIYHPAAPHLEDNKTWKAADPGPACPVDGLYKNFGRTWRKGFPGYPPEELERLPRVTTETGVAVTEIVSEEIHGWHLLTMYLAQFKRGWKHMAVYLLRDRTDESGNQRFGFYRPDYTPRPAAVYVARLTRLLREPAPEAATPRFSPEPLDYEVEPRPETVHELLLQKRDRTWMLILWNERVHGSDRVKVRFGRPMARVISYALLRSDGPEQTWLQVREVELDLERSPQVLCIFGRP